MCIDFFTGIYAAYKLHELDSTKGSKGLWKKIAVFVAISFAYLLDTAMSINMFRGMVISGFAIIEALSILENIDRMGFGEAIPYFLRSKLKEMYAQKYTLKESDTNDSKAQYN